ncbi:MAG: RHS repeat protein, partial [Rhodospirillales bacterium]|nr:RHS repeat protein [Rhodospirillales bacterium]
KLGNFSLSFTDLTVNAGGLPIAIGRTYDTLHSHRSDAFGHGWTLNYQDAELEITGVDDDPRAGFGDVPAFTDHTRVAVTLPGGQRELFAFTPQPNVGFFGAVYDYVPAFTSLTGSGSTLVVEGVTLDKLDGQDAYVVAGKTNNYNPAHYGAGAYVLTTRDGTAYTIDAQTGFIGFINDALGNEVEFDSVEPNVDTITSRDADENITALVTIRRDHLERITHIIDNSAGASGGGSTGNTITYTYDDASGGGNLASVTDRSGRTTTFSYGQNHNTSAPQLQIPPHYLTTITDPRGVDVMKVHFDADGRLDRIEDASGADGGERFVDLGLPVGRDVGEDRDEVHIITHIGRRVRVVETLHAADHVAPRIADDLRRIPPGVVDHLGVGVGPDLGDGEAVGEVGVGSGGVLDTVEASVLVEVDLHDVDAA